MSPIFELECARSTESDRRNNGTFVLGHWSTRSVCRSSSCWTRMIEFKTMRVRRLTVIVASFLVIYALADLSRTGFCLDSDCAQAPLPLNSGLSQPDSPHAHSSGEGCF